MGLINPKPETLNPKPWLAGLRVSRICWPRAEELCVCVCAHACASVRVSLCACVCVCARIFGGSMAAAPYRLAKRPRAQVSLSAGARVPGEASHEARNV